MESFIVEKDGKEFVDVVRILPEKTGDNGKEILWSDLGNDRIELSVQKFGVRGGNAKSVKMNGLIQICNLLFEGLGLWMGDGRWNQITRGETKDIWSL